jgi:hypothetical protein
MTNTIKTRFTLFLKCKKLINEINILICTMGYNAEQVGINANYLICCSTDFLD